MKSSTSEKITYRLGGVGNGIPLALANSFIMLYYTDSVLIAASFAGTMMFIARLLDGVSDIVMGIIIEKTNTRFGKARPWILIGAIPLALSVVLMFNVPASLPPLSKNVYVFITYIFMTVICYTVTAMAYGAMFPRISLDSNDRNKIAVVTGLMSAILTGVMVAFIAPVLDALGGESSQKAWTILSSLIAAVSLLFLMICFFFTKEKLSAMEKADGNIDKDHAVIKTPIKEALPFLLKGRYFYILIMLFFTGSITNGTAGIGIYYVRDVLGDANLMGLFTVMYVIPLLIMMPFVPKIFARFGKRGSLVYLIGFTVVIKAVMYIFPVNIPVQLAGTFLGNITLVPLWLAVPTMVCDLVDFGDFKKGFRMEGLATSVSSFGTKLGTGLGSAMLGFGLSKSAYDAMAVTQSDLTKSVFIFFMIGLPGVMCIFSLIFVFFWDMEKYKNDVQEYITKKRGV